MARYEHLPIYKQAMDLTIYCEQIVRNFSCYHKYTLGSELREKSREIVGLIIKANFTVERLPLLLELRERLEGLKVLIRICNERLLPGRDLAIRDRSWLGRSSG